MKLIPLIATISLMLTSATMLNANAADLGDINKVNGSANVASDQHYADISMVNGRINMANNSSGKALTTVNGSINLADNVQLHSATTVNGKIVAGNGLKVATEVSTVNGRIQLGANADINGDISTVNGDITLIDGSVAGNITTLNGDISLKGNTVVQGDLIYKSRNQSKSWWSWRASSDDNKPTLHIDKNAVVKGKIILEQSVNLKIDNPAMLAKVVDKSE
jgi:DUF4097 and DUF4098 domain-containing protein YvlB